MLNAELLYITEKPYILNVGREKKTPKSLAARQTGGFLFLFNYYFETKTQTNKNAPTYLTPYLPTLSKIIDCKMCVAEDNMDKSVELRSLLKQTTSPSRRLVVLASRVPLLLLLLVPRAHSTGRRCHLAV